jgi:hypothetical protein
MDIKEINMDINAVEELKVTYNFEWGKKLLPSKVETDPPGGSAAGN